MQSITKKKVNFKIFYTILPKLELYYEKIFHVIVDINDEFKEMKKIFGINNESIFPQLFATQLKNGELLKFRLDKVIIIFFITQFTIKG